MISKLKLEAKLNDDSHEQQYDLYSGQIFMKEEKHFSSFLGEGICPSDVISGQLSSCSLNDYMALLANL